MGSCRRWRLVSRLCMAGLFGVGNLQRAHNFHSYELDRYATPVQGVGNRGEGWATHEIQSLSRARDPAT